MMKAIFFAIAITSPNLLLIGLGFMMKKLGQASDEFVNDASFLVFNYSLPTLLFFSLINSKVNISEQMPLIGAGVIVTFSLFVLAELYAKFFIKAIKDKGVFVQGVFRSNLAIIGLATIDNAYGDIGLSIGAIYIGVITILFNILAVITLSRGEEQDSRFMLSRMIQISKKIIKNPLIIALVSGFIYKLLPISLPPLAIQKTGSLLAAVTLPLALICVGATLNMKSMLSPSGLSMKASLARIVIAPMMAILVGLSLQLEATPIQMGVLFLMVSAPTATAGFVMAKAMGGNEELAANILAFTTVFSTIGMGMGAGILHGMGWM